MSNPLQDLSRIVHDEAGHVSQGHDLYTRPRSSGPPMELVVVVGMGALILIFILWAMFRPAETPTIPPELRPEPAVPAAPPAPVIVQEWKAPTSPWATKSPARAAAPDAAVEQPADSRPQQPWSIENSVQATIKVDPQGDVYVVVSNRAPRTVVNLQLGSMGADHIILMPPIPGGKTVQKKIDDVEMIRKARAGELPPLSFYEGEFAGQ